MIDLINLSQTLAFKTPHYTMHDVKLTRLGVIKPWNMWGVLLEIWKNGVENVAKSQGGFSQKFSKKKFTLTKNRTENLSCINLS